MQTINTNTVLQPPVFRKKRKMTFSTIIAYIVLISLSIIVLIPFFWMISSSLKTRTTMFQFPPQWIPTNPQWYNYVEALTSNNFGTYFINTFTLCVFVIIGQVISCTLVAYGFSRFRFRGRETLFFFMLATMLIPGQVTMIPMFIMFTKIGWLDSYLPLIVPAYFANPFFVFLMRQFLQTIPTELDEAAKIDGANSFYILWKILLPLLRPSLTIIVVFTFTEVYNDFMGPLIYLNSQEKFTVAIGLANFIGFQGSQWHLLMAAATVALMPMLILYYFAQKQLIGGIASMGLKG